MHQAIDNMTGGMAIDIGAHIGSYTLRMARHFQRVIAFEPNPFNRHILQLNLRLNEISNVRVEDAALSNRDQNDSFFLHRAADGTGSLNPNHYRFKYDKEVQVKVRKLDTFELEKVDLLKIDAEGSELDVLRGAKKTIGRSTPILAIEVHQANTAGEKPCNCDACNYLRLSGYDVTLLGDSVTTPVHWVLARHATQRALTKVN
jgi:FkbM family methyltransferase